MLFCKLASKIGARRYDTTPIEADVKKSYDDAVRDLLEYQDVGDLLQLSENSRIISKDWFLFLEPLHTDELENMGDWSGKLHGATLRKMVSKYCIRKYCVWLFRHEKYIMT